ncbi:MAG TPA: glycosyl hydrolase family 18 protein [Candidatus Limnocylindrales bacterium]|nr:glycosyl hydrolase family 18 protein [Candidatus Limnocylindrales bacterium]
MRAAAPLSVFLLASATLVGAGGIALVLGPSQEIQVSALEVDGRTIAPSGLTIASAHPRLTVALSRAVPQSLWQVSVDGRPVAIPAAPRNLRRVAIAMPSGLPPGSRHVIDVFAGPVHRWATFRVAPALVATVAMRLHALEATNHVTVLTTVHFSRVVKDRILAQDLVEVPGDNPQYQWPDANTLQVVSSGVPLGARVTASVDDGILDVDGSWTTVTRSVQLTVPAQVTSMVPGKLTNFYYVNTPDAHASLFAHLDQIDMLSPAWYQANADGSLSATAYQDVIDAAHAHGIQIVPLVQNANVDAGVAHAILADPARRLGLAARLVQEAKTYGYAGFQLDFEQVPWTDRDLLTALVQDCAAAFHAASLTLSVAVIPRLPGDAASDGAALDYYHTWSGAYDFAALAQAADFLAFMTYDEHNGITGPGSVSGLPWMRQALEFSLQGVPPVKATLGLPTYYRDWDQSGNISSSSVADALTLAAESGASPSFDPVEDEMHLAYSWYGIHHDLWYENGDTIRRKLPLVYEFGLRGISVWRLGFEDPSFWDLIPARR